MNHIDQKLLELYVLKDEGILPQRDMIEQHLNECAGCRELYARMEEMYSGFFANMETEKENSSETVLARVKKSLIQHTASPLQEIRANYEIERAPIRRVMMFARRHPFVSSTMSLFVVGFFALLGLQMFKATEKVDDNPSYYRYSPDNKLEVYNKENKLLWVMPLPSNNHYATDETDTKQFVSIVDLDNDKINEVICCLPLGENKIAGKLLLYDGKGRLKNSFQYSDTSVHFRNTQYPRGRRGISQLLTKSNYYDENEIITFANAAGYSTQFITRFDAQLNVLGEYWHFGGFNSAQPFTSNGKKYIAVSLQNDIDDENMKNFSALVILDPQKIIGKKESQVTTGFGLPQSNAEEYYIRFPESDIEKSLNIKTTLIINSFDDSTMVIRQFYQDHQRSIFLGFYYFLNLKTMMIDRVKFITRTEWIHKKLKDEGKIHSVFNDQYLENLKNNVEYWDGEKWSKRPVRVQQTINLAKVP